jgi:hypothetical protein
MPMYSQQIAIWDVRNLEAHMQHVANDGLRRLRVNYLNEDKREALLAYLVVWAWKGSGLASDCRTYRTDVAAIIAGFLHGRRIWPTATYDPTRGWSILKVDIRVRATQRVVDWYRSPAEGFHDLRSPKPDLPLSLDAPAADTTEGSRLNASRLSHHQTRRG